MTIQHIPHFAASNQLSSDPSGRLGKIADDKKSGVEAAQSSFMGDLSSFIGKALSGGLSVATAASSLAIPGASLGISKLGEAAAGSLLSGLMSSTSATSDKAADSGLAAVSGDTGARMMAHQAYQHAKLASSPGANFLASA